MYFFLRPIVYKVLFNSKTKRYNNDKGRNTINHDAFLFQASCTCCAIDIINFPQNYVDAIDNTHHVYLATQYVYPAR